MIRRSYGCFGWLVTASFIVGCGGGGSSGSPSSGTSTAAGTDGRCKRGVALNGAPSSALSGLSWWYSWSSKPAAATPSLEFVPMIRAAGDVNDVLPAGAKHLLGFNEPNFKSQANLSPQQAAALWPSITDAAKAAGVPIGSPAVNFCGSASNASQCTTPSITDPYTYLRDFFAACSGCEVDYVAVHWYNCDLPSLQGYLEGGSGSLEGFVQFGKPVWLTEFACDSSHSAADQKAYMQAAVPFLEDDAHVQRYAWFSASPIPNALLTNADGSLTDLGQTYLSLSQSCP